MVTPLVLPRMKQANDLLSYRVDPRHVRPFVVVAERTCQREVFIVRRAAALERDYVINGEG